MKTTRNAVLFLAVFFLLASCDAMYEVAVLAYMPEGSRYRIELLSDAQEENVREFFSEEEKDEMEGKIYTGTSVLFYKRKIGPGFVFTNQQKDTFLKSCYRFNIVSENQEVLVENARYTVFEDDIFKILVLLNADEIPNTLY